MSKRTILQWLGGQLSPRYSLVRSDINKTMADAQLSKQTSLIQLYLSISKMPCLGWADQQCFEVVPIFMYIWAACKVITTTKMFREIYFNDELTVWSGSKVRALSKFLSADNCCFCSSCTTPSYNTTQNIRISLASCTTVKFQMQDLTKW